MNQQEPYDRSREFILTKGEQQEIKEKIISFMDAHPLQTPISIPVPQANRVYFYMQRVGVVTLFLFAVVGGSGVSLAAERSLPGDILYPIKTQINERISTSLALTEKNRAKLEAELISRRLVEAEQLAIKGKLDIETSANIGKKIKQHVNAVTINISELKENNQLDDAIDINTSLNSNLEAHKNVLSDLKGNSAIVPLVETLDSVVGTTTEQQIYTPLGDLNKQVIHAKKDAEVRFQKLQNVENKNEYKEEIDSVRSILKEGEKNMKEDNKKEAIDHFSKAAKKAEKSYHEATTRASLKIKK